MRIKYKFTFILLWFTVLPILISGLILYRQHYSHQIQSIIDNLSAVASAKEALIEKTIETEKERVRLITNRFTLKQIFKDYLDTQDSQLATEIQENLNEIVESISEMNEVALLDANGKIIVSSQESEQREVYHDQKTLQTIDDHFFLSVVQSQTGNMQLALYGPMYFREELIGYVRILTSNHILDDVVRDFTGLGETGEVLLAKEGGPDTFIYVARRRFPVPEAISQRNPEVNPMRQALEKRETILFHGIDDRGVPVIAATRYLEELGWGLVVKKDRAEVFAPINQMGTTRIGIILLMAGLMTLVSFYVAAMVTKPISRLYNAVSKISKGDFNCRVEIKSRDEIGRLSISFNAMAQKLKHITDALLSREEDLTKANQSLEEKVKERTALAEKRAEKLRDLASALTLAEQKERRRLAQILHDNLQQMLIAAKIGMAQLKKKWPAEKPAKAISNVEELLDSAVNISRSFTVELSPPVLRDGGLEPAMEWLARWFKDKYELNVEVRSESNLKPLSEDVKVFFFQAVRELLLNVVKHAKTDQASIHCMSNEKEIIVTVQDQGEGFNIEETLMNDGDGFGLFHIRERLETLGGKIEVESSKGRGTIFRLYAPAMQPRAAKPSGLLEIKPLKENRRPSSHIRILVVDDHKILRQGLTNMLEGNEGFKVVGEAGDGEEALEKTADLMPDIVVMDITMPRVNGVEATERIKERFPAIQVIGLSLHESEDMAEIMQRAGASAYLSKSGPIDQLVKTIRDLTQVAIH